MPRSCSASRAASASTPIPATAWLPWLSTTPRKPARTVIIAPDRAEREELTQLIRADLRAEGKLASESRSVPVLIERQLTNRGVAAHYTPGDLIQYRTGNAAEGIAANSSARVLAVDANKNLLTIETRDGDQIAYDPAGLRSVTAKSTVYREDLREVAVGERIQLTAALNEHGIRNRDFATVERIAGDNSLSIRLDNGKTVELNPTNPATWNTAMPLPMPKAFPPTG